MAQTIEMFRQNLATPDYGVAFMIANNPEDIADNLRSQGFIVSDADGIVQALNELLATGNSAGFRSALTVPVRTDRLTSEELAVLAEVSSGMANATGEGLPKNSDGSFNVSALFGGLATGYLSYLSLAGQNQVNPQAPKPEEPKAATDNTMAWVLGIAAVVVVIVVVVMLTKGKK